MRARRLPHMAVAVVTAGLALGLAGCGSSPSAADKIPAGGYYVSIGDSYAAGFQPTGPGGHGHDTTNGYASQVIGLAAQRGHPLTLENFGCDGATTASLLHENGCTKRAPGTPTYPDQPQAAAAEQFLRKHRASVDLVTISIGGNDVTRCAKVADPIGCASTAVSTIKSNLSTFLPALRSAAGPNVRIVGLTYPDVILGEYLSPSPSKKALAALSTTAFKSLVNPALQGQYQGIGATFVDVTAATGAYVPFTQTTDLAPYGTIPTAVADICRLTYYCQYQDIHPRTAGYHQIATLIAATIPQPLPGARHS